MLEVLTIHSLLIDEFGGADGVRDMGALESAVFRPQTGYYDNRIAEASALMESLVQNHPFLDGNKRIAVAAADVHLRMHGLELAGDSAGHHAFIIGQMESGSIDRRSIEEWLRANVESNSFGALPDLAVPSRDEWDRGDSDRKRLRERIGKEMRSPPTEEESEWLESDLDD